MDRTRGSWSKPFKNLRRTTTVWRTNMLPTSTQLGVYSLIAAHAAVFRLPPDVHADPQQIRSYTRPGHEPSSTSPTVLREAARKTPPPGLSAVHKVHRGDRSLTQRGCPLADEASCCLTLKDRCYHELAGQSYRPSARRRGSSRTVELCRSQLYTRACCRKIQSTAARPLREASVPLIEFQ